MAGHAGSQLKEVACLDLLFVDTGGEQVHGNRLVLVVQSEGNQSVRVVRLAWEGERAVSFAVFGRS